MILIYLGRQKDQQPAFEQVMRKLSLTCRFLDDQETASTLHALFTRTDSKQPPHPLDHPLMVMKDLRDDQFQVLMENLRAAGLEMKRKAMWTKHNQEWSFVELAEEIEEEHQYFVDLERLYAFFEESNHLDSSAYTKESWHTYAFELTQIYQLIQNQQPSAETLKQMLQQAKEAKQQLQKQ